MRPSVAPRAATPPSAAFAAPSAMPSDAEAWNSPAERLRSMYGTALPAGKPPLSAGFGSRTPSNVTEWLPDARMPSASQSSWIVTPRARTGTMA